MSDRELLELAAKAAGIAGFWVDAGLNIGSDASPVIWNPLADDGDALRLAVKLRMTIRRDMSNAIAVGWSVGQTGAPTIDGCGPWFWKEWLRDHSDEATATRRAIVRAAAEIGRQA